MSKIVIIWRNRKSLIINFKVYNKEIYNIYILIIIGPKKLLLI